MSNPALTKARLHKQEIGFEKDPMQNAFVKRQGHLNFYFCLFNLDEDFKNGFYFGLLELHPNYPFAAPKLFFYTPNGRYEINMPICTSFTNYHQESWTSAWNVRSLIQGTISFMYSNQASYGCRHDSSDIRRKYAIQSLQWNMKNQNFSKLFGETIKKNISQLMKKGIKVYSPQLFKQLKNENIDYIRQLNINHSQIQSINEFKKQDPTFQKKENMNQNNKKEPIYHHPIVQLDLNQQLLQAARDFNAEAQKQKQIQRKKRKKILITVGSFVLVGALAFIGYIKFK